MAGKFSGLYVRLKELFGDHHWWYQSVICLVTTGLKGCSMYPVYDFIPPKGNIMLFEVCIDPSPKCIFSNSHVDSHGTMPVWHRGLLHVPYRKVHGE